MAAVTRPTVNPNWNVGNTSLSTVAIQPSNTKLLNGWAFREAPAWQFMNWLFWNITTWIQWLDQGFDQIANVTTAGAGGTGATYTWALGIQTVFLDPTAGAFNLALLDPTVSTGMRCSIKNISPSTGNVVTISNYTVDGQSSLTIAAGESILIQSNGTAWYQISAA